MKTEAELRDLLGVLCTTWLAVKDDPGQGPALLKEQISVLAWVLDDRDCPFYAAIAAHFVRLGAITDQAIAAAMDPSSQS